MSFQETRDLEENIEQYRMELKTKRTIIMGQPNITHLTSIDISYT